MFKRFVLMALALAACSPAAWAQTAGMISFQGLIKDSNGDPVSSPVNLEFRIYNAPTGGTLVDMDGDGIVEDVIGQDAKQILGAAPNNGIVSEKFGPVSPKAFNGQPRYLEVRVDGNALSRVEMATAPATAEQFNRAGTGTPAIHVDEVGEVGIGTTNPMERLHLSTATTTGLRLDGGASSLYLFADASPFRTALDHTTDETVAGDLEISRRGGAPGSGNIRFITGPQASYQERVRITQAGNVGIGTTNPTARLHVMDSTAAVTMRLVSTNPNGDVQTKFERNDGQGDPAFNLTYWGQQEVNTFAMTNDAGAGLHVTTGGNVVVGNFAPSNFTGSARLAVMDGNVGIGTTGPVARLHVIQTTSNRGMLVYSDVDPEIEGPVVEIRNTTTTIGALLKVVGDSDADSGGPWDALVVEASGVIRGRYGTYHGPSDGRLKKDITDVPNALDRVLALRGVNFHWRDAHMDGDALQMGLIAQEVEGVFPEAVHTADDQMRTKAVEYEHLTPALIEAIKEQQCQIEELRSSGAEKDRFIAEQERRMDELAARLERLEARITTETQRHRE